jgi:hypothetical protein
MVVIAKIELSTRGGVVAHPPTTRLVAIEFLDYLVNGSRDRSDNAELGDIRTESRPESVVRARLVHRSRMHSQPVIDHGRFEDPN